MYGPANNKREDTQFCQRATWSTPVEGTDYHTWATEPFLFFVNAKGEPSPKTMAGDYAAIGDFDYDYDSGSGEGVVAVPMAAMAPADMGAKIERLDCRR